VAISTNFGHHGSTMRSPLWEGGPPITVYPAGPDDSGGSVILGHVNECKPDIVLTLYDAVGMESMAPGGNRGPGWGRFSFKWVPYAMVDDGPPLAAYHADTLRGATALLCLTRFAQEQLVGSGEFGDVPIHYVPHTIDTETYSPGDQEEARRALDMPLTKFLVLFVGEWEGWPGRKGLLEAVQGFAKLGEEVGWDQTAIMLQTKPLIQEPPMTLVQLRDTFGVPRECWYQETTHHSIVGRSKGHMADLYRAADVLVLPSRSEAFGLTVAEAEACGTPAITTSAHASREVSGSPEGYRIHPRGVLTSWKLSRWWNVDPDDVYQALSGAFYRDAATRKADGLNARQHILKRYRPEATQLRWNSVLDAIEEQVSGAVELTLQPSDPVEFMAKLAVVIPTVEEDKGRRQAMHDMFDVGLTVVALDEQHKGFPVTVNRAVIGIPPSQWLLIWNDDCLPDAGMLDEMFRVAGSHNLDLVAPVVFAGEEKVTHYGWEVYHGGTRPLLAPWDAGTEALPMKGNIYQSLFMVKRKVWEHLDGFDERYAPGYYEDADFIRRAVASGFRCGVALGAKCLHETGSTFRKLYSKEEIAALSNRNRRFFNWKFNL
jgi:glycosyltransferase involved in cell wall biosynthesis